MFYLINTILPFGKHGPCLCAVWCMNCRSTASAVWTVNCLCRKNRWPYFCHPSYERCYVSLIVEKADRSHFSLCLSILRRMRRTIPTKQMLWNGKSDHFTSHLFCLPIYCCKAGVQRSRCLAKHEGAVPLSLWGWLSLLSLLMHRHDSCLISWSC